MQHMKLKSAVGKYSELHAGGATPEQLTEVIAADEKKYTPGEIVEIINALQKGPQAPGTDKGTEGDKGEKPKRAAKLAVVEEKPASPNSELDLSQFNYSEMKGDVFQAYVELVGDRSFHLIVEGEEVPVRGQLREEAEYDFVLHKAVPIMKARFPGVRDTPWDMVGITMKEEKPIHKTRIAVRTALEMNAQILNAHSRAGHGKYYFLAKQ